MSNKKRSTIAFFFLGGSTVSERGRPGDAVLKPSHVKPWLEQMSEIDIIAATEGFFITAGTDTVGLDDWIATAKTIKQRADDFDGFVVVHQLATIGAGAMALSLMFKKLTKPVVLCGSPLLNSAERAGNKSNHSSMIGEFSARANFINAAQVAVSDAAEVMVLSGSHIYRGASVRGAAEDVAGQVLGKIDFGIMLSGQQNRRTTGEIKIQTEFDRHITMAEYLPGIDLKQIISPAKQMHAVLISVSDGINAIKLLNSKLRSELPPRVIIAFYAPAIPPEEGIINIVAPSRTAAALKLMWALGQTGDRKKIHKLLAAES